MLAKPVVLDLEDHHPTSTQPLLSKPTTTAEEVLAELHGLGRQTINGFAMGYDTTFPSHLRGNIPEEEFDIAVHAINQTAEDFLPCWLCRLMGYLSCVSTFGLALCCLDRCTLDVESHLHGILERINRRDLFQTKGLKWRLKRSMFRSWIEISRLKSVPTSRRTLTLVE